jgi:hypothetical protein
MWLLMVNLFVIIWIYCQELYHLWHVYLGNVVCIMNVNVIWKKQIFTAFTRVTRIIVWFSIYPWSNARLRRPQTSLKPRIYIGLADSVVSPHLSRAMTMFGFCVVLVLLFCTGFPSKICLFRIGRDLNRGLNYINCIYYVVTAVNTCILLALTHFV